jgi:hypothetical protein
VLADLTESRAAATYAALTEIERLAALIPAAPALADRMAVADVISQRYGRYRELLEELEGGRGRQSAMAQAAPAIDEARRRVEPGDWWEGLAAVALCAPLTDELFGALLGGDAVVFDGAAASDEADALDDAELTDEASEVPADAVASPGLVLADAVSADGASADAVVDAVLVDGAARWAAQRLHAALDGDPVLAARIAMWGRRLVGEAIVLCREFGGERYPELADRLAANHVLRLAGLGLSG